MAELALHTKLKEIATNQAKFKTLNREKFHRTLILEEKLTQIAINKDKLDHRNFIKLVTKNLMILIHARKKFGTFLDLDSHKSIKEALMAQLKLEEQKAMDSIRREYVATANKFMGNDNEESKDDKNND